MEENLHCLIGLINLSGAFSKESLGKPDTCLLPP